MCAMLPPFKRRESLYRYAIELKVPYFSSLFFAARMCHTAKGLAFSKNYFRSTSTSIVQSFLLPYSRNVLNDYVAFNTRSFLNILSIERKLVV